jgi:hypothetical protein
MNSHSYLKSCVVVLAASMLLLMVAAESKSNVLFSKAFAGNTCVNTPGGCFNTGSGNQNNNCYNIQSAPGETGCLNSGDGSTQSNLCQRSPCQNTGNTPSNIQSTKCFNAGTCSNTGDHTTVIAANSPCSSSGDHSTTICTSGRIVVVKQH